MRVLVTCLVGNVSDIPQHSIHREYSQEEVVSVGGAQPSPLSGATLSNLISTCR